MHSSAAFGDGVASAGAVGGDVVMGADGAEVGRVVGAGLSNGPGVVVPTGAADAVDEPFASVGVGVSTSRDVDGAGVTAVRGTGVASSMAPGFADFSHTYCLFTWDGKNNSSARAGDAGGGARSSLGLGWNIGRELKLRSRRSFVHFWLEVKLQPTSYCRYRDPDGEYNHRLR